MLRFSRHTLENCSALFGVRLVQGQIPMCHHWKLKPSACHKRASMQAVTVQGFPVLFLSRLKPSWKKHPPYKQCLSFSWSTQPWNPAFPHDFCNTSVWYFFVESFATKEVVYNSWLCLLGSLCIANACPTDMASTKALCSLENSLSNGPGLPGFAKRLSGSAELCTQYFVLFCLILIGSDGPNICRTPLSPIWDEVTSSIFHQGMEPVQISVKACIIPWLYCRLV